MCAVPMEDRRGHRILWHCSFNGVSHGVGAKSSWKSSKCS